MKEITSHTTDTVLLLIALVLAGVLLMNIRSIKDQSCGFKDSQLELVGNYKLR
jgi:hypothetical protein